MNLTESILDRHNSINEIAPISVAGLPVNPEYENETTVLRVINNYASSLDRYLRGKRINYANVELSNNNKTLILYSQNEKGVYLYRK